MIRSVRSDGSAATRVTLGFALAGVTLITVIANTTPALATDATPYTWTGAQTEPLKVRLPGEAAGQDVTATAAGAEQTCSVTFAGEVICWPEPEGDAAPVADRILGFGAASGRPASTVSVGDRHACASTNSGEVYCWGRNFHGQLGNGTTDDADRPSRATGALIGRTAVGVAAGGFHTCALTDDGAIWCWGRNNAGQLGDGTTSNASRPVKVVSPGPGVTFTSVAAGFQHTCATASDGNLYCWGANDFGQLGDGTGQDATEPLPVNWPADVAGATSVTAGKWHTCATAADGRLWCWGRNDAGQLGNGTTDNASFPVQVGGEMLTVPASTVSAGVRHTCALGQNSQAYCWGRNDTGQLGNGNTTDSLAPVRANTNVSTKDFTPATGVAAGTSTVALIAQGSRPGPPLQPQLLGTTLTWQPPRIAGIGTGALSQYRVSYLAPGQTRPQVFATLPASLTSIDLAASCPPDSVCGMKGGSLLPGQEYTFTVAGVGQSGTAGSSSIALPLTWSGPEVFAPSTPAPAPPDMPVVTGFSGTTLFWSPPFNPGIPGIGQYSIRVRPFGTTTFSEYAAVPASLTSLDLVGPCPAGGVCPKKGGDLQPGVTYEVWVYAVGGDGAQSKLPRRVSPFAFTWSG